MKNSFDQFLSSYEDDNGMLFIKINDILEYAEKIKIIIEREREFPSVNVD